MSAAAKTSMRELLLTTCPTAMSHVKSGWSCVTILCLVAKARRIGHAVVGDIFVSMRTGARAAGRRQMGRMASSFVVVQSTRGSADCFVASSKRANVVRGAVSGTNHAGSSSYDVGAELSKESSWNAKARLSYGVLFVRPGGRGRSRAGLEDAVRGCLYR